MPMIAVRTVHAVFTKNFIARSSRLQIREFKRSAEKAPIVLTGRALSSLPKACLFTVGSVTCFFTGAIIWQYENVRALALKTKHAVPWMDKANTQVVKAGELRQKLHHWWHTQHEGQKIAWCLIAANTAVFLMWKIPALVPFMTKWFTSNPSSKVISLPMFLSCFSHYSAIHLACNMFVLHSFSSSAVHFLGKEQFLAMYLSSGVASSLFSYFHKAATRQVGVSLGASGAIMGLIGAVCVQYPESRLALVFLPTVTFTAGTALKALLLFDTSGVVLGWKFLDHAAHLGGCLFGIFYVTYGQALWQQYRGVVMKRWHNFRESKGPE